MRKLIIITVFLTVQLLANYAFSDEKKVKIDMHGGKSEAFSNTSGFSQIGVGGINGTNSFNMKKPKKPTKPEEKDIPQLEDIKLK